MRETTLSIMGHALIIRYTIFEGGYVDWNTKLHHPLLTTLLRMHYNEYICAELRRIWFEEEYEEAQIAGANQMALLDDDVVF